MKNSTQTLFTFALLALPALAATDPDLVRPKAGETADVIVQYASGPAARNHQRVLDHHGRVLRQYEQMSLAQYAVTPEALADLENDPDVVSISPNRPLTAMEDYSDYSVDYNTLEAYYQSISKGKAYGMGIAVLDSGINTAHPDLYFWASSTASRVVYSQSFVGGDTNDEYGHGTHVAGIVAGVDNIAASISSPSRWIGGIAMDANLINLKVLDANGNGSDASVIAGINRAIQLKNTYNIRVLNLSLGRPVAVSYKNDPLCHAVEQAWKAGIVVVVAAGNNGRDNSRGTNGYGTITAPGNDPYVITVGAVNGKDDTNRSNDVIATYSSKGPTPIDHIAKPDLVAPGNRIVSYQSPGSLLVTQFPADRLNYSDYNPAGPNKPSPYFMTLSGTSMAAPFVAGAAAMLADKDPSLTPDQIKARLMKTAWRGFPATMSTYDPATHTTYSANHDLFTIGAGMVDMWAAYNNTDRPTGSAASPSTYYDAASRSVKLSLNSTNASSVIWGTGIIWGTSVIWGTSEVNANSVIWGTSLIWGTSTNSGFSVIWGTSSPWAMSATGTESLSVIGNGEN